MLVLTFTRSLNSENLARSNSCAIKMLCLFETKLRHRSRRGHIQNGEFSGLAEMGRGHAETLFKKHAERKGALETNGLAYIVDGQVIVFNQLSGLFQLAIDEVLMGSDGIDLFEHPEKMLAVHGRDGGDSLEGGAVLVVGLHPVFGRRDAFEDLKPGGGFQGLDVLRMFIGLLVLLYEVLEQASNRHVGLQCGEGAGTGAQIDEL